MAHVPTWPRVAGIGLALAGIVGEVLLENGSIQDVAQFTAAMVVLGGTFGAVLVTTPLAVFLRALEGICVTFCLNRPTTIETLIRFAT